MLRSLRVIGIVVFAVLAGLSANTLKQMQESGELQEAYNSRKKANVTLLFFSVFSMGAIGFFELPHSRGSRRRSHRRSGKHHRSAEWETPTDEQDMTSIYSAPKTMEKWNRNHIRPSNTKRKEKKKTSTFWLVLLPVCSVIVTLLYLGMTVHFFMKVHDDPVVGMTLQIVFGLLSVLSLITSLGVMQTKMWGITAGYALAVCNMLIFPVGTAFGLFLMMALMLASPGFMEQEREKRKKSRRKPQNRTSYST
ncbi:hypothetical protein P4E94_07335 [Pontiellaceae bacterium B12219]|nr:hypothetical protein [Pontiellaceae bacterium B12219]